jgi:hypothetical protein
MCLAGALASSPHQPEIVVKHGLRWASSGALSATAASSIAQNHYSPPSLKRSFDAWSENTLLPGRGFMALRTCFAAADEAAMKCDADAAAGQRLLAPTTLCTAAPAMRSVQRLLQTLHQDVICQFTEHLVPLLPPYVLD